MNQDYDCKYAFELYTISQLPFSPNPYKWLLLDILEFVVHNGIQDIFLLTLPALCTNCSTKDRACQVTGSCKR